MSRTRIQFVLLCALIGIFYTSPAQAAAFRLEPSSATFIKGCDSRVDIKISTQGINSNAADARLLYTPGPYALSINNGSAFENYAGKSVSGGVMTMTGFSTTNILNTGSETATFGSIIINSPGDPVDLSFDFTPGNTADSNIADMDNGSTDALTSVVNGNYTFVDGFCETAPPFLANISPPPDAVGVPLTTNISFNVRDTGSGVDIDTLTVQVTHNDETITYLPSGGTTFSYTGTQADYAIFIDPVEDFLPDLPISVRVEADDFAANHMTRNFKFNHISCEELGCDGDFFSTQCEDGEDNDFDGLTDMDDPGCENPEDNNEYTLRIVECSDGIDNDDDGLLDGADPGCEGPDDDSEFNPPALYACNDSIDNDGDGVADLDDPDCLSIFDNSESPIPGEDLLLLPAVERGDMYALLAERTIRVPLEDSSISSLPGDQITFVIESDAIPTEMVNNVVLTLGNNEYTFAYNNLTDQYTADILMPAPGDYIADVQVFYSNGQSPSLALPVISQPFGLISSKTEDRPIKDVGITIERIVAGVPALWDASAYEQKNPIKSDLHGRYGFIVPNGTYRISLEHPQFGDRRTLTYEVTNNVINENLGLLPLTQPVGARIANRVNDFTGDIGRSYDAERIYVRQVIRNPGRIIQRTILRAPGPEHVYLTTPIVPNLRWLWMFEYIRHFIVVPPQSVIYLLLYELGQVI